MGPLLKVVITCVVICCSVSVARSQTPTTPQDNTFAESLDFRQHQAPPEVRVLASPQLRTQLELDPDQQRDLDPVLRKWETEYRTKKAEIEELPANNTRDRRGWPPTRDRRLRVQIEGILMPDQKERFELITFLWSLGPVRSGDGFRYDAAMKLSPQQHRELHALDVQWVLFALPVVDAEIEAGVDRPIELYRTITAAGWKFQPQRDVTWRNILTDEQALIWQQQELRNWLRMEPSILLADFSGRSRDEIPRTGTFIGFLIPYFEPPAVALSLSQSQMTGIKEILAEQSGVNREKIREIEDREARRAAYVAGARQWLRTWIDQWRRVETLMTGTQKETWYRLVGETWLEDQAAKLED